MSGQKWTWQEEAWLRNHYADTDIKALMKVLGFSAERVRDKANKLGLKKSVEAKRRIAQANPLFGSTNTLFRPGKPHGTKAVLTIQVAGALKPESEKATVRTTGSRSEP